ncbi:uncharacterized protein LOC116129387 [Pistacia vera]|uniref:uncharacterized protein LOC116129387 n=1 Tax=Pistacia vera TaxID=55513 RepID=UPI001262BD9B|nr:uncharacterized protein LOC116129387 [Pistacia vera]
MERKMMDAASGGAIVNKTPRDARDLISIMAANSQQFGFRQDTSPIRVNELEDFQAHHKGNMIPIHITTTQDGGVIPISTMEQDHHSNTFSLDHLLHHYNKPPQVQPKGLDSEQPKALVTNPPFPTRLTKSKKEEEEKEILETFCKVEVNIPLLDAIKQVPRYAKFLKELCTNKRKLKGNEKISMGENVSAILQKKLPPQCKDPGMFTIPCKLGDVRIEKAMLDPGASINVMPLSIYSYLNIGPLKETGVIIQLADRSNVYPKGVLEDVLAQVNGLVFPADFYVLDMEEDDSSNSTLMLLGKPFLKTYRTKIDVHDGTLTMEFDGEIIKFNSYDTMRYPNDVSSVFVMDVIDTLAQE